MPPSGPWRKKRGPRYDWHWCTNCSDWPTSDYEVSHTKPTSGGLCDQCQDKQRNGNCA